MKSFLKKKTSHTLLFGLFVVIFSGVYYLGFYNETQIGTNIFTATLKDTRSSSEYIVELREDGFYPEELEINKGDTVKFTTTRSKPFWPASNLHPSHTIYSEFDSREPINPEDTWSFRFDKTGEWKYHDHLAPIYKGKIVVLGEIDEAREGDSCEEGLDNGRCWESYINRSIDKKGIDDALYLVAELHADKPSFTSDLCHAYVHAIGEKAYTLYAEDNYLNLSPQTSLCDYGFYHGFMERLVQTTGSLNEAREFCNYAGEQSADAGGSCFHGIGHGAADPHNPKFFGDPRARVASAIELCEELSSVQREVKNCLEGVFNELGNAFANRKDGMSLDANKPLAFCRIYTSPTLKHVCYREFAKAVLGHITDIDFYKSIKFIEDEGIEDERSEMLVMHAMANTFVLDIPKFNFSEGVRTCRVIQEHLREPCFTGLMSGFMVYGKFELKHDEALQFCMLDELLDTEQEICRSAVASYLGTIIP